MDKKIATLEALVPNPDSTTIAVLVSGGVDSALALTLLKEAGYNVEAFYLKIWLQDEFMALGDCPWEEDLTYVKPLTDRLKIPLHVIPFQETYWEHIIESTVTRIKLGETPNPDMLCNSLIKFGAFFKYLEKNYPHCTKIASGHYAQLIPNSPLASTSLLLKTAPDPLKDQTYFLARLTQTQLNRCLFPIGHLTKSEVRHYAKVYDLPSQNRKDSQGLCFLGKIRFRDFIRFQLGEKPGVIIERETQKHLGTHNGFWYYTMGQRQGLDLATGPWYVVDKDIARNYVYVSRFEYSGSHDFFIRDPHWLNGGTAPHGENNVSSTLSLHCHVKIRHGSGRIPCTLSQLTNTRYRVTLEHQEQGIAPGQFAVFYDGDTCLGSGVIQGAPT